MFFWKICIDTKPACPDLEEFKSKVSCVAKRPMNREQKQILLG